MTLNKDQVAVWAKLSETEEQRRVRRLTKLYEKLAKSVSEDTAADIADNILKDTTNISTVEEFVQEMYKDQVQ